MKDEDLRRAALLILVSLEDMSVELAHGYGCNDGVIAHAVRVALGNDISFEAYQLLRAWVDK